MQKKPTPPQGGGPLEVWLRTILLPFIYSLELTSVVGMKKVANPSGGYALVSTPGGGSASPQVAFGYRGQWTSSPPSPYLEFEMVLILTGASAGTYLNLENGNTNNPSTGIGWVQIAPGDAYGRWQ